MITFEDAHRITMEQAFVLPAEQVSLQDSLDRILAADLVSDMDMPPFDKSAVDGYACRISDIDHELEVVETIPAGKIPQRKIWIHHCSKIMTGAMLPAGADCVIMVEDTKVTGIGKILFTGESTARNICFRGEDIKKGQITLSAGTRIAPQHIAVMASAGNVKPEVYKKVRIGILSTGDELVEPDMKPGLSQIRNSNAAQLMAQVVRAGGKPTYYGIARDDMDELKKMISAALKKNEIVILTGGVSMGDFDHVPEVMQELGFDILFKSIAIQPGRPTVFGRNRNKFIFGLPGNPASSFVLFEILVRDFMEKLMGITEKKEKIRLMTGVDFTRKKTGRKAMIPVKILGSEVFPIEYHGSAHINAYTAANGIIAMDAEQTKLEKGLLTDVRQV